MTQQSSAILDGGTWRITLQPQHAILFKRLFDGVEKDGQTVTLSDTPRHTRDLLWFMSRHPIDVNPLFHLLAQADVEAQREKAVQTILASEYTPCTPKLAFPLRDYQARAADLAFANGGLLLADSMGLGKTVSAIGLFARREALPAVVVTLTALPPQWVREVNRFVPDLRAHAIKQAQPYPLDFAKGQRVPLPDVITMSYSKLNTRKGRTWVEKLVEDGLVRTVIFDEGQELRNHESERYRAAKRLRESANYCLMLSGTPIYNHGAEIHNVIEIVQPGALGTRAEFLREWCGRNDSDDGGQGSNTAMRKIRVKDPVALGHHLRDIGVMLRRTRADVGRELPAIQRIIQTVETDQEVFSEAAGDIEKLCRTIVFSGNRTDRFKAAGDLDWMLRRATGVAKAVHVANFVRMLIEDGRKVVLFGWHHEVYTLWRRIFSDPELGDLRPAFFTGNESAAAKERERARFIRGETPLFIMSLRAGAGLDGLQFVSDTVVFGELDWSPGVMDQCECRVFRDGQPNPVMAFYLVTNDGSDPVVLDTLGMKNAQSTGIRDLKTEAMDLKGSEEHIRKLATDWLRRHGKLH